MADRAVPRRDSFLGAIAGFLTRRLRNQIVVPYLVLATVFAMAGTYVMLNSANESLHTRFNNQLQDAARGATDAFTKAEVDQLAGLRAVIYTQGFSGALSRQDAQALRSLAAPQALNYGFDSMLVVRPDGATLLNLNSGQGAAGSTASPVAPGSLNALIAAALHPTGTLDKVSAVVSGAGGQAFYTAGPVLDGTHVVGAVLVGTDLLRLTRQVARSSLSDGAGFYTATRPSQYMLTSSESAPAMPTLPEGWYRQLVDTNQNQVRLRTLTLPGGTYVEALGGVPGHGVGGASIGVYGVLLSTTTLDSKLQETLLALLPLFAIGLLLIIAVGHTIAGGIHRPVAQLVDASNHVAQGDFDVQIPAGRKDELGVLASRFNDMVSGLRQSLFVKDLFGRFVSPEVSAKLLAGQIELGGEQREVTVLFSDLRDFTHLSEQYPPAAIMDLLNEYFSNVIEAAQQNGGIVNKFGGDSTLIIFGAPVDIPDHPDRALATALVMQAGLDRLNAHRTQEGWPTLRQGIGINTGTVVAGQVGSDARMEYTVIGDAVNLASRLQSLTKDLPECDIVFSEYTLAGLSKPSEWLIKGLGPLAVRGKEKPVRVYGLLGSCAKENGNVGNVGGAVKQAPYGGPLLRDRLLPEPSTVDAVAELERAR